MKSILFVLITLMSSTSAFAMWPTSNGPFAFAAECEQVGPRDPVTGVAPGWTYSVFANGNNYSGTGNFAISGFQIDNTFDTQVSFSKDHNTMFVYNNTRGREMLVHLKKYAKRTHDFDADIIFDTFGPMIGKKGKSLQCKEVTIGE